MACNRNDTTQVGDTVMDVNANTRTLLATAAGLLSVLALSSCSAIEEAAVGVNRDGNLYVTHCDSDITGVNVVNADTGDVIWDARPAEGSLRTSGEKTVTQGNPPDTWTETVNDPHDTGQVTVNIDNYFTTDTITVTPDNLDDGYVKSTDGVTRHINEFNSDVCGDWTSTEIAVGVTIFAAVIGIMIAAAVAAVALIVYANTKPTKPKQQPPPH